MDEWMGGGVVVDGWMSKVGGEWCLCLGVVGSWVERGQRMGGVR
jgi:hypothetical protein